jgi:hypothetical protein
MLWDVSSDRSAFALMCGVYGHCLSSQTWARFGGVVALWLKLPNEMECFDQSPLNWMAAVIKVGYWPRIHLDKESNIHYEYTKYRCPQTTSWRKNGDNQISQRLQ